MTCEIKVTYAARMDERKKALNSIFSQRVGVDPIRGLSITVCLYTPLPSAELSNSGLEEELLNEYSDVHVNIPSIKCLAFLISMT